MDTYNTPHGGYPTEEDQMAGLDGGRSCPICSSSTKWRLGKYGFFRGCSRYPQCRGKIGAPRGRGAIKPMEEKEASPHYSCAGCNQTLASYALLVDHQQTCRALGTPPPPPHEDLTPKEIPTPMTPPTDLGTALFGTLAPYLQEAIDTRATIIANKVVSESGAKGAVIEWKVNGESLAKVQAGEAHKMLGEILDLVRCGFNNILIVGPAGSGKTTLAHDLAKALNRGFAAISCTSGMSEGNVVGRAIPNIATGSTTYQTTDFVKIYENGGVFLFDEIDAADANMLVILNSALANGHMSVPNRVEAPTATRHADTLIIAAANTYGNGADRMYVGRNQLDAAFLDRFCGSTLTVDYDQDLESRILPDARALAKVWEIRKKVSELKLRRVVGTRFVVAVAKKLAGEIPLEKAVAACVEGWTADEKTRVGVA